MPPKPPATDGPLPKAPAAEMAIALSIAVLLDAVGIAKCALMSVRYDEGVSAGWRSWSAKMESSLGFGDGVDVSGRQTSTRLPGLQSGWLFGRQIDLSDAQWRGFRTPFPTLLLAALVTAPLVALARRAFGANAMPLFHAAFGVAVATCLHGVRVFWLMGILTAHFFVCKTVHVKSRPTVGIAAVWLSAITWLASVQYTAHLWTFTGLRGCFFVSSKMFDPARLDGAYQGMLPRWWVHFNLMVLRLISFGVDLNRARERDAGRSIERVSQTKTKTDSKRVSSLWKTNLASDVRAPAVEPERRSSAATSGYSVYLSHADLRSEITYSYLEFVAYCLYPPLYLAGPTAAFDGFAPQLRAPQKTYSRKQVVTYALVKFASVFLLLEVWTHLIYTNAMALSRVWTGARLRGFPSNAFGPFEVGVTSLATLNFMYLKFTVMWRFFRTWALMCGVEAPENMLRCVNNNSTILGFWKGWHASYNKWLVRYVYVPLGGSEYKLMNSWVVIGFVGAWHDKISARLVGWSVIFAAFLAPEIFVGFLGKKIFPVGSKSRSSFSFRSIRSLLGAVNVHVLIAGNMVGYVVGLDGLDELVKAYFGQGVWRAGAFFAWSLLVCAAAAHVGFEQRAGEARAKTRGGRVESGNTSIGRKGGKGS